MIVAEASYEVTDPTVDSQIAVAGSGRRRVRRFHDAEIRRAGDPQGLRHRRKPVHYLNSVGNYVASVSCLPGSTSRSG
jgi:hypothetical protein